ncbi:hypothetical protein IAT38_004612 [Cryptococcus sp. DSM 104549]
MSNPQQEAALPITNTLFPPPPPFFQAYTDDAVARYERLTGATPGASVGRDKGKGKGKEVGKEDGSAAEMEVDGGGADGEEGEKELREKLDPPRADWVNEDGRWMCFGTMYTTEPSIPTAQSIGLAPFVDPAAPPQESLPPLLHSFLHTLLLLIDALTQTARTPDELMAAGRASEGDQYIQHLTNLTANMMVASNQLRSAQSEATLVLLMEKELEERRRQTEALRAKCREIAIGIKALRGVQEAAAGDGQ